MTLTASKEHPWLKNHNHAKFTARMNVATGAGGGANGNAGPSGVDRDASMQSAAADASMNDVSHSEPAAMPGAFDKSDGMRGEASRIHRRRDIIINANEEAEAGPSIPEPSQEMLDSARAEEDRFYASTSRPNKRKGVPFEGSLTPMPDDPEDAANGIQDLSMADAASNAARSPSPPATRSGKRAKATPAKTPSPPKSQKGRGKQQAVGSPMPEDSAERPRRSARLNEPSPQKKGKTGRR